MKFTIERAALVKMIEKIGGKHAAKKKDEPLLLYACVARVFVQQLGSVAGLEALVFEDGTCQVPRNKFLKVLRTYYPKRNITIEVNAGRLAIGSFTMPVIRYSPVAKAPGKFQVFPVTDLDVLPNKQPLETKVNKPPSQDTLVAPPQPESVSNREAVRQILENPPQSASSEAAAEAWCNLPEGEFFSIPDDEEVFEHVIGYVRRLCALPKIKPQELAGLAHALYALERLPRTTPGVAVDFSIGVRWGTETEYSESWVTFHISEQEFRVGRMECTRNTEVGGDHHTTTVFEISRDSYRTPQYEGDSGSWMKVLEWVNFVDEFLEVNKLDLMLWVSDESEPDCMTGEAG